MHRMILLAAFTLAACTDATAPTLGRWDVEREDRNPVIALAMNPAETVSQYTPSPVVLPDGSTWVYVKGDSTCEIWAYRSPDGVAFELAGKALGKGPAGAWDAACVVEPVAVFDPADNVIRLWYKGTHRPEVGVGWWAVGYAEAPATDPLAFTRGAAPILEPEHVTGALGLSPVVDVAVRDVVREGGAVRFYGYASDGATYRGWVAAGAGWTDIHLSHWLPPAPDGWDLSMPDCIFRERGRTSWQAIFTVGARADYPRHLMFYTSSDGLAWEPDTVLLGPGPAGSWDELRVYASRCLRKAGASPELLRVDDVFRVYYSGSMRGRDQSGLLYLRHVP